MTITVVILLPLPLPLEPLPLYTTTSIITTRTTTTTNNTTTTSNKWVDLFHRISTDWNMKNAHKYKVYRIKLDLLFTTSCFFFNEEEMIISEGPGYYIFWKGKKHLALNIPTIQFSAYTEPAIAKESSSILFIMSQ